MISKRFLYFSIFVSLYLLVVSLNLLYQAKKYLPFSKPELVFPGTPVIDFLQKQEKPFRFEPGDVIPQNMWMPYGLESSSGSDALLPKRTGEFIGALEAGEIQRDISRVQLIRNYDSPLFPLLNAKYILVKKKTEKGIYSSSGKPPERFLDKTRYRLVFEDKTVQIYEDLKALPRAFWVYDFEAEKNSQNIIGRLLEPEFDLRNKVILEEEPSFAALEKAKRAEIEWIEYTPGKFKLVTESDKPGMIFLANNFYPGWRALIDETETRIYRADYTFQAVYAPAGEHSIKFVYDPLSFRIGLFISFLTASGLFGFGVISLLRPKKLEI